MSDSVTCIVCHRARARADAEVLKLTEQEKAHLRKLNQEPVDEIAYCRPCFRLMSDQRTALDLMKGSLMLRLRAAGVSNAEDVAERFKNGLLAKTKRSS